MLCVKCKEKFGLEYLRVVLLLGGRRFLSGATTIATVLTSSAGESFLSSLLFLGNKSHLTCEPMTVAPPPFCSRDLAHQSSRFIVEGVHLDFPATEVTHAHVNNEKRV